MGTEAKVRRPAEGSSSRRQRATDWLLGTGLRLGAALGLAWGDLDFAARTLRVRRALQRIEKKLQFVEPKSERSRRVLSLPGFVVDALKRHQNAQRGERLLAGSRWVDSGLVFASTIGTPLDERNVRREFKTLLAGAGLPSMRLHDLHHTSATLLLSQGVDPRTIMETLGHSQISLTMNTYSHVPAPLQANAADKLDAVLSR